MRESVDHGQHIRLGILDARLTFMVGYFICVIN